MINIMKMILKYIIKQIREVLFYIVLCLASSLISLATPYITGDFIDSLMMDASYEFLYRYCCILGVLFVIKTFCGFITNLLYARLQMQLVYSLNVDIIKHIQSSEPSVINTMSSSYLSQQINRDTNELIVFVLNFFQNTIINILIFLVPTVILIRINNYVTYIVILCISLYAACYFLTKKRIYTNNEELKEAQSKYFSSLNEQFRYYNFIKLHSISEWFANRLDKAFHLLMDASVKYKKFSLCFSSMSGFIRTFMQICFFAIGGKAIIDGDLTIGQFTIFSSYFSMMISSVTNITGFSKSVQESQVSYNRIKKIFDIPPVSNGERRPDHIGKISITNLSFSYDDHIIFKNRNFEFENGKIYIIMGKNGVGKSTLMNIIAGIYHEDIAHQIFFDDLSMRDMDLRYYRQRLLAVSEQNTILVPDTLLSNIALGDSNVNLEELNKLVEIFDLKEIVKPGSNAEKYDVAVNENNNNLSGGEKQKISIIRTLMKNANIMIFDEPTSALDIKSKKALCEILQEAKMDKIIFVVSHDRCFDSIADEIIELVG